MPAKELTRKDFLTAFSVFREILKPHKKAVGVLVFLTILTATTDAVIPLLAGKIFDGIIALINQAKIVGSVFKFIGFWLILRVITDIAEWRISLGTNRLGARIESEYISRGFGRLLRLPISFHKKRKQGELGEKINRAAGFIDTIISRILVQVAPDLFTVILVFILTFTIEPRLAAVLAVAVPVYIFILVYSVPGLARLQRRMIRAYSDAYGDAYEGLGNIREIKQVAAEKHEQRKLYRAFVFRASRLWQKLHTVWDRLSFAQRLLITLTQLAIFSFSVFLVRDGTITPGELVAFNAYAALLFRPFVVLGNNWQTIQNGVVAAREAEKILSTPPERYRPKRAVALKNLHGEVEFKHVSFRYEPKKDVLTNISFRVELGQKVALVGESGVGKTTITDLLLAFYFPSAGKILIDGHDIRELDLITYRRQVGIVPQEVTLFNDTVEENIRYGSFKALKPQIREAARLAHADEFINNFPKKYKTRVGWRGIKLSTGQKQRIAIARAIIQNPKILILDEPTSALDAQTERYLQESLKTLMAGRTTFVIAHRLSTVRDADVILVLEDKGIVESGTHEELIERPAGVYRKLYELQIGLYE